MTNIDVIAIFAFAALVLICGISFSRSGGKDMKSFFAAGGAVPWWINGLSLFMGFFSAGTFVVWGSIAYTQGLVAISIQWTMALAGLLVGTFVAARWRKTNALTAAEYITVRFGKNVQKLYTYLFLGVSMFTTGAFLYPVAKLVEVATGFPLEYCILALGGLSILYVTVGGLWAVVVTDVLQFIILFAAIIIVIPLSFGKLEAVGDLFNKAPEGFYSFVSGEYTWWFVVAFGLYNLFFLAGNWAYVQRYTSVNKPKDAKKVGWLFGVLYIISPIFWMLPPMIYRIYNPELNGLADEGAYLLMCKEALPGGILGMMLGGMIFATASSLNATLNISAGVFTNDIIKAIKPDLSNKSLIKIARSSTIGFGVLAVFVALMIPKMGGIVNVVISLGALTGAPLYLPILWSLFSKRVNTKVVLSTTVFTLLVNVVFKFFTGPWFGFTLNRTEETVLGVGLPIVILFVAELYFYLKNDTDPKHVEYKKLKAKEDEAEETEAHKQETKTDNSYSIRVMGLSIAASGLMIIILGILADFGHGLVISIGTLLLTLGVLLTFKYGLKKS